MLKWQPCLQRNEWRSLTIRKKIQKRKSMTVLDKMTLMNLRFFSHQKREMLCLQVLMTDGHSGAKSFPSFCFQFLQNWRKRQSHQAFLSSFLFLLPLPFPFVFSFLRVQDFVTLYSKKLGMKESVLKKTLWGDFYFDPKAKKVIKGQENRGKLKPMFVQFVLENIWAVYDATVLNQFVSLFSFLSLLLLPLLLPSFFFFSFFFSNLKQAKSLNNNPQYKLIGIQQSRKD